MRTTVFFFLLAVFLISACDDDGIEAPQNPFAAQDTFDVTVTKSSRRELDLRAVNGTISITGDAGATTISVFAIKRVEAPTQADADARVRQIEVVVDSTGDAVLVETVQPSKTEGRNYIVNYEVQVPRDFNIVVTGANGDVALDDINGIVSVTMANGRASLAGVVGSTTVILANGAIDGQVTLPLGELLDMRVANGEIDLMIPQSTSAQFHAEVEIGSVTVVGLNLQDAVVERRRVTGRLGAGDGAVSLIVANGDIFVEGF